MTYSRPTNSSALILLQSAPAGTHEVFDGGQFQDCYQGYDKMGMLDQYIPPAPVFTEKDLGDQSGRVFIITGATSGIGLALAHILFAANGTVYIGARSSSNAMSAVSAIRSRHADSRGSVEPLVADLADLSSIKGAVNDFLAKEERLDVLVHNAGVMIPPKGSKTSLGLDLELATNCLGPFLLTSLLVDILRKTAAQSPSNSVRIVWVASMLASGPPPGGVQFDQSGEVKQLQGMQNYMQSKAGVAMLAAEYAKRLADSGILSVSVHPGLVRTELQRHLPKPVQAFMGLVFKPPVFGAYTELYAGWSANLTKENNGSYFIAWGRRGTVPKHIRDSMVGGTGDRFFRWCEGKTRAFDCN